MTKMGTISQYQGPFSAGYSITLDGNCIIGISINEDDYMKAGSQLSPSGQIQEKSFRFTINGNQIWMGRTYKYQTEEQVNETVVSFPDGAPSSLLLEAVYCIAS